MTAPEPRLLASFRRAMAVLYSLPTGYPEASEIPQFNNRRSKEANDFLVELQSRNVRRKILSLHQKYRFLCPPSSPQHSSNLRQGNNDSSSFSSTGAAVHMGSSWLAFLAVLCQMNTANGTFVALPPERLFAAQSVLHRSRRNKLIDAIDLEVEHDDISQEVALQMYRSSDFIIPVLEAYRQLAGYWNPFLGAILSSITFSVEAAKNEPFYEEQIKGQVMMLTLACVSYITACEPESSFQRKAILDTLGSAIAILALRVNYLYNNDNNSNTSSLDSHPTGAATADASLVWMISHTYEKVLEHAQAFHSNPAALGAALAATLGALPDTILGSAGGARGRLSVDPRTLETAVWELRTRGFVDLWRALQHISVLSAERCAILTTLEQWARFLCFPRALVEEVSGLLTSFLTLHRQQQGDEESNKQQDVALRFLYAVFEGGLWTVEKVLTFGLGLSEQQLIHQAGKRKQTSRSKRRQRDMLSNTSTSDTVELAENEVQERGEVACQVAMITWPSLGALLTRALEEVAAASQLPFVVDGEGPIGCVAAAAQSCLPFLLLHNSHVSNLSHQPDAASELFQNLSYALVHLCRSPNQAVACLAFQPLYALHKTAVAKLSDAVVGDVSSFVLDVLMQCLTQLSSSCPYPEGYFADLRAESDGELETYRNNIRDLFRALTGGEDDENGNNSSGSNFMPAASARLLCRVTQLLRDELVHNQQQVPPENLVHTFSALAKPLNRLARDCLKGNGNKELSEQCILQVLEFLSVALERITSLFREPPQISIVLPLARTMNLATASLTPLFSALAMLDSTQGPVLNILPMICRLSLVSLRFIPELATSEDMQYEIRGTMRGPGGEDHVGVLSLMRLAGESEQLTSLMARALAPEMKEICALHEYLKSAESWGEHSNPSTTPKSRRILLGVICQLELSSRGQAGASEMLSNLIHSILSSVISINTAQLDDQSFFLLCETAFDLATLLPLFDASFFDHGENKTCLQTLVSGVIQGYAAASNHRGYGDVEGAICQWNRLRGGLYTFFLGTNRPDFLSETLSTAVREIILAECDAVTRLFASPSNGTHAVFNDDVVSPDVIPAGIFVMSIGKQFHNHDCTVLHTRCINTLWQVSNAVNEVILIPASFFDGSSASDPRCSIAEAWFTTMAAVAQSPSALSDPRADGLLTNSIIGIVALIFSQKLSGGKDDKYGPNGMSMNGPHSLALMDFLSAFLALGSRSLGLVSDEIAKIFPVAESHSGSSTATGLALFLAAVFRAIQGALPPWVVENIPSLFSDLYSALGKSPAILGDAINASMVLRTRSLVRGVEAGQLYSGYAFDGISTTAKQTFQTQVLELANADNAASWKRLKQCVKAACGGKKKDSDFRQKPALTRWEFERI